MRPVFLLAPLAIVPFAALAAPNPTPEACMSLKSLSLPNTTIESAELVPAGVFKNPAPGPGPAPTMKLPDHCRVVAWSKPTSDSNIEIDVWLPAADWNGKFQG